MCFSVGMRTFAASLGSAILDCCVDLMYTVSVTAPALVCNLYFNESSFQLTKFLKLGTQQLLQTKLITNI